MSAQHSLVFGRYAEISKDPEGPGDGRPTALAIIKDEGLEGKLNDKVFLVTGASSGIGVETARALAHTGAKVVITARDMKRGQEVIQDILKDDKIKSNQLELLEMHLNSLNSVRNAAQTFLSKNKHLNVLIANAGIAGVSKGKTEDGFEMHFGVNHLAHFLLFELLKDTLIDSSTPDFQSRVVAVGSMVHRFNPPSLEDPNFQSTAYNPMTAYASSKTANSWFANHIESLHGSKGVHGISLHPGGILTGLQAKHDPEYLAIMQTLLPPEEMPAVFKTFKSVEQGAATTVLAAVGKAFEGKGRIYLDECQVAPLYDSTGKIYAPGYAPHCFDEEGEKQLWSISLDLVGLKHT